MKRMVGALAAIVLITGCTAGGAPTPTPNATSAPPASAAATPQVVTSTPVPTATSMARGTAEEIWPNEAIMATMTCEPINAENAQYARETWNGDPSKGVQVEIGEGLTQGVIFSVVVFPAGDEYLKMITGGGEWYSLGALTNGNYSWDGIHWDAERLERGQSALAKALDCVNAPRYGV